MRSDRPSTRPIVAVSTSSFARVSPRPLERLEQGGFRVRLNPHGRRLEQAETRNLLAGATALIAGTERLDRAVLASAPTLRLVSRCGTGLENVDLEAAAELGIEVRNTPDAHVDAVAELTLAGILDLLRSVAAADRRIRDNQWSKPMGRLLRGKTVGLIGLGRVGRSLVRLLEPFAVRILAHDAAPDKAFARRRSVDLAALDVVVAGAEILSLHVPLTKETRHLVDRRRLALMPAASLLINCSRGGLVDEQALVEALRSGRLAGAHLDTFEQEPYTGPLARMDNVLLTPHIGSYAAESRLRMELEAVDNVLAFFEARTT